MQTIGMQVLKERHPSNDPKIYRVGFHVPPYNSVFHLHLHIAGLPANSEKESWTSVVIHVNLTAIFDFVVINCNVVFVNAV